MIASFFIILLYLISTPLLTHYLRRFLEPYPAIDVNKIPEAQAIVVLGADRYQTAPEYGNRDTLGELALQRVRYAATLHKKIGLPLLASGGNPNGAIVSEAVIIREVLHNEFDCKVEWIESHSLTTYENARNSAKILQQAGIDHIILVTHAWHLPRAVEAFQHMKLKVIPAGTCYYRPSHAHRGLCSFLPSTTALHLNRLCFHELLGRAWYHFGYYRTD